MRLKLYLLLALVSGSFLNCSPKEGISESQKLAGVCKVWGFLKYYHPNVGSGEIDWDSVLIEILPSIIESSEDKYHTSILKLIESAGVIDSCNSCITNNKDSLISMVSFSWFDDEIFNNEISKKLNLILKNKKPYRNYYVEPSNLKDADFSSENAYKDLDSISSNYRLLSLFRYWNAMEYFYPYKNILDNDWDKILSIYIPKFVEDQSEHEYYLNIRSLASNLNDGHSWVSSKKNDKKYRTTNFRIKKIDNQFVVSSFVSDSLAKPGNLKIGDIITHINGKYILEAYNAEIKYTTTQSNITEIEKGTLENLFSGEKRKFNLTVNRANEILSIEVTRYTYSEVFHKNRSSNSSSKLLWKKINDKVSYVDMGELSTDVEVREVVDNTFNAKILILDFRNYPPFMPYFTFLSHFFVDYPTLQIFTLPDFETPGYFKKVGFNNELHKELLLPNQSTIYNGKIILLVDGNTKSRSEFFVSILQSFSKTITIGSQTAGSNGNVRSLILPGDISTQFTGMGSFYGDGSQMQRTGIKIDIIVSPTLNAVKTGRDEYLEKALEFGEN